MYRALWRIEESFKITKSVLDARPVYVNTSAHINAHFLICFIALTLARLTEIRLKHKYPIARIIETLRAASCSHLDENHWLFDYANDVTDDMNTAFNLNFGRKVMTLGEIKKHGPHF